MIDIKLDELIHLMPGISQIVVILVAAYKIVCLIDNPETPDNNSKTGTK